MNLEGPCLDSTLTQLINEVVRLTNVVIRAARDIAEKDQYIAQLESKLNGSATPDN